jgi:transposase
MYAAFKRDDCSHCQDLSRCTSASSRRRTVTLKAQPLYEALNAARARQKTDEFKQQYKKRSGIEETISQGVRAFGLRRTRYRNFAKTRLQHIAAAVAMNLVRLDAWFSGKPLGITSPSAFVRVMTPVPA